jgi:hypothetical protein
MSNRPPTFWKLHWITWLFVLIVSGTVFYLQIQNDFPVYHGSRWHFAKGWPFPYYYDDIDELYVSRLLLNIFFSASVIASTIIVFQAWALHKFQYGLKSILLIQLAIGLLFSFRCFVLGVSICRVWAPWYLQIPLGLGLSCLFFCLVWIAQKIIAILVKSFQSRGLLAKTSKKQ